LTQSLLTLQPALSLIAPRDERLDLILWSPARGILVRGLHVFSCG